MRKIKLNETGARGWFVGPFEGAAIHSNDVELAIADWPVGPIPAHYHSRSVEAIVIISGRCIVQGQEIGPNEMFVLDPGDVNDSNFLEPSKVLAIKMPAGANDKIPVN
jgi:hypothetical protein